MTESKPRRSRISWAEMGSEPIPSDVPPFHSHRQPRALWAMVFAALALLTAATVLLAIYAVQDHNYVLGRGEIRDRENAALREQIRQSICDLLDQLPEGGLLDRPREKYHCGPGIPLSDLPPEVQDQILDQRGDTGPPAPEVQDPGAPPVEPPQPPATTGEPAPPDSPAPLPGGADGPMQTSEPPPLSPPSQLRELVCDLLPVCPES
jgi:hypothetical protein